MVSFRFDHRPVYVRFPLGKACRNKVGTSHRTKRGWTPRLDGTGELDIVSSNFESLSATFSFFAFCFAPARVKMKHYDDYDPTWTWGK